LLDEGCQALASGESQARSQFLDRGGQRKRDRNRPEHGETDLGAELRVGADSRRIVVGGSRDEPGADVSKNTEPSTSPADRVHQTMPLDAIATVGWPGGHMDSVSPNGAVRQAVRRMPR